MSTPKGFGAGSLEQLVRRLRCGNAEIMPLWNDSTSEWVCYIVPPDESENGVYLSHNGAGEVTIEINVPGPTLVNGYESYLRMGFLPPNAQPLSRGENGGTHAP